MGSSSSSEVKSESDATDPDNRPLQSDGWQSIQEKRRSCTDILFLLLILASWIAMTLVGFAVSGVYPSSQLRVGNLDQLIYASDYQGNICGTSEAVKNKKYGYYLVDGSIVCVSSCPSSTNYNAAVCRYEYQSSADSSASYRALYIQEYQCLFQIDSFVVLNRCFPTESLSSITSALQTKYNVTASYSVSSSTGAWFETFISDVYKYRGIIFGIGIGVSTFLAFLYIYILRIPGLLNITLFVVSVSVLVFLLVGSFLLWALSNEWRNDGGHPTYQIYGMRILSFFGFGLSVIYICLMFFLRKQIALAINIVKEACVAIVTMPVLVLLPIIQVIGVVLFLVPWVIYVLFLAASGENKTNTNSYTFEGQTVQYSYKAYEFATNTKYAFLYMIFCYFWTSEFILALGQLTLSLSVTAWYFTRDKSTIGNHTTIWAFSTASFYHAGTAAFGALIIAVIEFVRAVLVYVEKKSKNSSFLIKYMLCVVQCCLWCLEKIARFINKTAYISTSIHGYSFFKAARTAFFVILRNILRVAAITQVSAFLLFLGKWFVVGATVLVAYLALAYGVNQHQINGLLSPLVFVAILAYYVSIMFSEVFSMAIDTILFCYIADEEMFPVAERFAAGSLQSTLQRTAQTASNKKIADVSNPDVHAVVNHAALKGEVLQEHLARESENHYDIL